MPVHVTDLDALPALVDDLEAKGHTLQIVPAGLARFVVYAAPIPKRWTGLGQVETR